MEKRSCPFCPQELNGGSRHIYACCKTGLSNKEIKFQYIKFNFPGIPDGPKLREEYEVNLRSLPDLKTLYGIDYGVSQFLLGYYGIRKRGISESAKKISADKHRNTCKKKYGVTNVSQVQAIKQKKADTFMERYGVDNIWKDKKCKELIRNMHVIRWREMPSEEKARIMGPLHRGAAKFYASLSDEEKLYIVRRLQFGQQSSIEKQVRDALSNLHIDFKSQFHLKRRIYDFQLLNTKLLIEVNGDFWHANPDRYSAHEFVPFPEGQKSVSEIWKKDAEKKLLAESNGYKVLYIWEKELKNLTLPEVQILLLDKILSC